MNLFYLQAAQGGSPWSFLIMMVLVGLVMYFFMIRPQQKKQKKLDEARNMLSKNDEVITTGGIYGKIKGVSNEAFTIEIAENVRIQVAKTSVYPLDQTPQE